MTLGIDLAAEPKNTAGALIDWSGDPHVVDVAANQRDDALTVGMQDRPDIVKIGIDCPLGWPSAFVDFVTAHSTMRPVGPAATIGQRRPLAYRLTDRRLMDGPLRLRPLSVSADRIAHAAFRAAALLPAFDPTLDRSGLGRVVEVYPAGSLRHWGLPYRGYKGLAGRDAREVIVDALAGVVDFGRFRQRCVFLDHNLDAVVAAMSAYAAHVGLATLPTVEELPIARVEGWIALPTCELSELARPT